MSWYLSYRKRQNTVMRVFETQDLAVDAACRFLDQGSDNRIEVGPMVGSRAGSVLNAHDLRRIYESRDARVPQPFRRPSSAKVRTFVKSVL
jgi:hypothetical protein